MALLAETVVEEFFNYQGYFTIRGVKKSGHEIDILAIKVSNKRKIEAIHVEVQVSENPVKYISNLSETVMKKFGAKSASSAVRRDEETLRLCCADWVRLKFSHPRKIQLREKLFPNQKWKYVFVHGRVKDELELAIMKEMSIETIDIRDIIHELSSTYLKRFGTSSVGRDIVNLFKLFYEKEIKEEKSPSHTDPIGGSRSNA